MSGQNPTVALAASNLRIGYGGRTVVDDITLGVDKREIVCLLGGSGCGKSTLLRGLAGLSSPQAGSVHFLGAPLLQPHPRAALVFQQPSLLPWLNVEGNVGFGLDFARQPTIARDARTARVRQAIDAVGLAGRATAYPAQLSEIHPSSSSACNCILYARRRYGTADELRRVFL